MDNHALPVKFSQRAVSWLIISLLVWQPVAPAFAAAITPNGAARMDKAANGVPVVNIAPPNAAGISHNQFKDYNVGKEGLILNNATGQLNHTRLGGIIQNNPNLKAGREAKGIINEVTGGSRSRLEGYTEVAGKAANVMVANPYGITCSGCGFINTPQATLTTGKPQFDSKGNLMALDVTQGSITVEGKGLDASNSDALSLISRATEVNAAIHAKDLTVTAGANRVAADGSVTAINGAGPAPTVAVDTGALGGMYANRIHLVSSDKGVGVNLGNLTARQGDITLDASGKLVLNNTLASGALTAKADDVQLRGEHKTGAAMNVASRGNVGLQNATLASDGKLTLTGKGSATLAGSSLTSGDTLTLAGQQLTLDKNSRADGARDVTLKADALTQQGTLLAGGDATLDAVRSENSGMVAARGQLIATGDALTNRGTLQGQDLTLRNTATDNSGTLAADRTLNVNTGSLTTGADSVLTSKGDIALNAGQNADLDGRLNADGTLSATADTLRTRNTAQLQSEGDLTLSGNALRLDGTQASKGTLSATAEMLTHKGKSNATAITLNAPVLSNSGTLVADNLHLTGQHITNSGLLQGSDVLDVQTGQLDNLAGTLYSAGNLTLAVPQLTNSGLITTDSDLTLAGNTLTNRGELNGVNLQSNYLTLNNDAQGRLLADAGMWLKADDITNRGVVAAGTLDVAAPVFTNSGTLQGTRGLQARGNTLDNQKGGTLLSGGALTLENSQLNNAGLLQGNTLSLITDKWTNSGNALGEQGVSATVAGSMTNDGKVLSQEALALQAGSTDNRGTLMAKALALHGDLQNSGLLQGNASLNWDGNSLNSLASGQLIAGESLTLTGHTLDNQGQVQGRTLDLTASEMKNSGSIAALDELRAAVAGRFDNTGVLISQDRLDASAAQLFNDGQLAARDLTLTTPTLINNGLLQGNDSLGLVSREIINGKGGQLISGSGLTLDLDSLTNQGLLQVNDGFTLTGEHLSNSGDIQADALALSLGDVLDNQGSLTGRGQTTLDAQQIRNGGTLAGDQVTLNATTVDNRGLVQGRQDASATADILINGANGKWLAGNVMTLHADRLKNHGTLQGNSLVVTSGSLTNSGVLNGINALTGTLSGTLTNSGQVQSDGALDLTAASVINPGRMAGNTLDLRARTLASDGLWQGTNGLSLTGDTLTTGATSRTLSGGALTLDVGQLASRGTIQGQQIAVTTGGWDNAGSVLSLDELHASVGNTLTSSGTLTSKGAMVLQAQTLDNRGQILSDNNVALSGQTLKNQGGIQGNTLALGQNSIRNDGNLTGVQSLTLGATPQVAARTRMLMAAPVKEFINGAGGQLLTRGALDIHSGTVTNNGTWQGQNILLNAHSLANGGAVQSAGDMQMILTGDLTSTAGSKITAMGTAALQALAFTNAGQWAANSLTLTGNTFNNSGAVSGVDSLSVALNNGFTQQQNGALLTGGRLDLNAASVTSAGKIQGGTLDITTGTLTNSGRVQGDNGAALTTGGTLTNNAGGEIISGKGLTVTAPVLMNYGLLQGGGETRIEATTQARNDGKMLSGGRLTLTTPQYTGAGWLQATDLILNAANTTNSGTIVADRGTLTGDTFTNQGTTQGGTLGVNYRQLTNGGTLLGNNQLTVNASGVTNLANGKLFSGGDLWLGSTGLDAPGQIVALGNLTLKLTSAFTAKNTLAAGKTLAITSNGAIDNNSVLQGQAVNLSAGGQLTNNGQITTGSGDSTLSGSGILLNSAGSVQGGGDITVASRGNITVNSFTGTRGSLTLNAPGAIASTALLYAANNLMLYANSITNQRGDMLAGNNLTMQKDAAGNANKEVINTSGTIETRKGDITIKTGSLQNIRKGLQITETSRPGQINGNNAPSEIKVDVRNNPDFFIVSLQGHDGSGNGDSPNVDLHYYTFMPFIEHLTINKTVGVKEVTATSEGGAALITSGKDLFIDASALKNQASTIYANNNISLKGGTLDNQSVTSGSYYDELVYDFVLPRNVNYLNKSTHNPYSRYEWDDVKVVSQTSGNNNDSTLYYHFKDPGAGWRGWGVGGYDPALKITFGKNSLTLDPGKKYLEPSTHYIGEEGVYSLNFHRYNGNVFATHSATYKLKGKETRLVEGQSYRAVIQAGGSVTANFTNNISNTNTTANAGGVSGTITAPSLNTLSNQTISPGVNKQGLAGAGSVPVNSPQWNDQLQGALQQINGGGALDNSGAGTVALGATGAIQKGQAFLGSAADLTNAVRTGEALTNVKGNSLGQHQGKTVDTSAYPLPTSQNGYFVTDTNPKSPYLITVNPKLNDLGQLDPALFGDLNKLLGIRPGAAPQETRSTYTDEKQFLGSSYMLDRLKLNPEYDYRFLGDAAFDTRYVSNVVLNQTGNRYLNGVGSELEQMRYLMDNAAAAQSSLGLNFGVSLDAKQIASLDHSILWWESAIINGETVMVPKVYLSPKDVTVNNGSVIAGNNVSLSGGNITNNGSTLLAKNALTLDSQNSINNLSDGLMKAGGGLHLNAIGDINNVGSTISGKTVALESLTGDISNITQAEQFAVDARGKHGSVSLKDTVLGTTASISATDKLSLAAGKDITLTGATLASGGDVLMNAWGDIALNANQINDAYSQSGFRYVDSTSRYSISQQGSTITAGGNLTMQAGRDINSQAAGLAAEKDVKLQAGRDVNLLAEETGSGNSSKAKKKTIINDHVRQQGTEIASGGDTILLAGRDVVTQAAQIVASGDAGITAGRNITLDTATESDYHYEESKKTKKGFLSKKTTHKISEQSNTREAGTLISGDNVTLNAGQDLKLVGASVVGDGNVALNGDNSVTLEAATNTDSSWQFKETKKSGLMGSGGIGFSIGSSKTVHDLRERGTTQSQSFSTVGSTAGNVSVTSGGQTRIAGADVIAGKDLTVKGDNVVIEPGHDKRTRDEKFEQKTSGLTLALSGSVGSVVNGAVTAAQAAHKESDSRLASLKATQAALSGIQAGLQQQLSAAQGASAADTAFQIAVSLGAQSSKSKTHEESDTVTGSRLTVGDNLAITATGKGNAANSGDITVVGSQLKAGKDVTLDAARDINLISGQNTNLVTGSNSSHGGSVGVALGFGGTTNGLSVSANANASNGKQKGNSLTHSNTTVDAGNTVTLVSDRDTALAGAQVNGSQVTADVGRSLTIASQQDIDNYTSKQGSVSGGLSYTFGGGGPGGSFSFSRDKMDSKYRSVNDQSGLFAGAGGFDVTVGEHTQLDGAVLASTATADKNRLDTGTLGFGDIYNEADFRVQHQGGGFSTGGIGALIASNIGNVMLMGAGSNGHSDGTTQAAISQGTIVVRDQDRQKQDVTDLSRDAQNANDSISKIFDKEKEQRRMEQAQLIGEIGSQVGKIVSTYGEIAAQKALRDPLARKAATDKLIEDGNAAPSREEIDKQVSKTAMSGFGTGSDLQRGVQVAIAVIQGLASGDLNAALAGASAPLLATQIKKYIGEENIAANTIAHALLGAVVAQVQGNNALSGAAGAAAGELLARQLYPTIQREDLTEEQKQTISALSTLAAGLAGGIVSDSGAGAVAGGLAGKNAAENNALSLPKGMTDVGMSQTSLATQMIQRGASPDELTAALIKNSRGQIPEGQDAVRGLLTAWGEFFGVPVSALTSNGEMTPEKAAEIVASGIPASEAKLIQYVVAKAFLAVTKTTVKNETGSSLIYHENFGGHAIEKHVGKSDAELIARFKKEPRLSASSSFYDTNTADRAIGNGIAANKQQLIKWLSSDQERLVLQHEEKFSVGKVIQKGTEASRPSNKITIVIDKDPLMPNGYRVHTAYPK